MNLDARFRASSLLCRFRLKVFYLPQSRGQRSPRVATAKSASFMWASWRSAFSCSTSLRTLPRAWGCSPTPLRRRLFNAHDEHSPAIHWLWPGGKVADLRPCLSKFWKRGSFPYASCFLAVTPRLLLRALTISPTIVLARAFPSERPWSSLQNPRRSLLQALPRWALGCRDGPA